MSIYSQKGMKSTGGIYFLILALLRGRLRPKSGNKHLRYLKGIFGENI